MRTFSEVRKNIESRIDVDEVHEDEDAVEGLGGESWSSGYTKIELASAESKRPESTSSTSRVILMSAAVDRTSESQAEPESESGISEALEES